MLGNMNMYLQGPHAQEQKGESTCVPFGEGAISAIYIYIYLLLLLEPNF